MKLRATIYVLLLAAGGLLATREVSAQAIPGPAGIPGGAILTGAIRASTGQPMEGVTVSVRAEGTSYTTSVFTDEEGVYVFPPLSNGNYRAWAQAVGFATSRAQAALAGPAVSRQDFTLGPAKDIARQMTGADWFASLPEATLQDRRMKHVFKTNCTGCHQPSYVLQNRFDRTGWVAILDFMKVINLAGALPGPDRAPLPIIEYHRDGLADYLTKVRGPNASALKPVIVSRPKGEATLAVITEYDIEPASTPGEFPAQDGSDWSEGTPTSLAFTRGTHDVEIDHAGNIWVVDSFDNPRRTYAKIDSKTGEVTTYKSVDARGNVRNSHGIRRDQKGHLWFNLSAGGDGAEGGQGSLARLAPATEKLDVFTPPTGMSGVGGAIDVDGKGKIWASTRMGAIQFDPDTGKFADFKSLVFTNADGVGTTYGVAADSQGNGYWAEMSLDIVGRADFATGKVSEIKMPPRKERMEIVTEEERRLYSMTGSEWNSAMPWAQGPRRMGGDRTGNAVWVGNWWGENLAKIDTRTSKVTMYPVPSKDSGPYAAVVDKNHIVWVNMMNNDSVGKFDPATEKWTEYMLPTHGAETRHIAVLDRSYPPTVVVPYWRSSKVARLQFRTKQELQELKNQLRSQRLQAQAR